MSITIPFSEACERNKDVILDVLRPHLQSIESVLEIGSGTAQHAVHFARAFTQLQWQCADQAHYIDGIEAQLGVANVDNVLAPLLIDVKQPVWVASGQRFEAVFSANTFHIMSLAEVEMFFSRLPTVIFENGLLIVYGPFKYGGDFTSESNAMFDANLRSRECGSAIRDFEQVNQFANEVGFSLVADHAMPANNQCLIWQHGA